jgi:hypothetical protein
MHIFFAASHRGCALCVADQLTSLSHDTHVEHSCDNTFKDEQQMQATHRGCAVCVADQLTSLSPDTATSRGELAPNSFCSSGS